MKEIQKEQKEKHGQLSDPNQSKKHHRPANVPNTLPMNDFHRVVPAKPKEDISKKRKQGDKKQIRDIERLLDREGLPQEIRDKKVADLKRLKKDVRQKKGAGKNELRYKKIKFIEKRKVVRKLEKIDKILKGKKSSRKDSAESHESKEEENAQQNEFQNTPREELKKLREEWNNKLIYIDAYPLNWKYVSLFAQSTGDSEKDKSIEEKRQQNMQKILQTISVKLQIRDKEMKEADLEAEGDIKPLVLADRDDAFFKTDAQETKADAHLDKRVVARDGHVGKSQRNIEKERQQRETQDKQRNQKFVESKWGIKEEPREQSFQRPQYTKPDTWQDNRDIWGCPKVGQTGEQKKAEHIKL